MLLAKIIKIDQCFTELFKKLKWHVFMDHDASKVVLFWIVHLPGPKTKNI